MKFLVLPPAFGLYKIFTFDQSCKLLIWFATTISVLLYPERTVGYEAPVE